MPEIPINEDPNQQLDGQQRQQIKTIKRRKYNSARKCPRTSPLSAIHKKKKRKFKPGSKFDLIRV